MFVIVPFERSIPAAVEEISLIFNVSVPSPPSMLSSALQVELLPFTTALKVSLAVVPVKSEPASIPVVKLKV